jgi:putative zinc finger/helix-turn-helix YgiT family protein
MPTMTTMRNKEGIVTRKCGECGHVMEGRKENYHYTECGLQSVVLKNILVFHCDCGAIIARIPAMAWLHRAITLSLISKESLLSGEEIRFLRKMANLNGVELAKLLGAHKTTLSKWENNTRKIPKNSDAALRLICFAGMMQNLVQQKDLMPQIADELKQLTAFDIKQVLREIKNTLEGPKDIRIDPRAVIGEQEPDPVSGSVQ